MSRMRSTVISTAVRPGVRLATSSANESGQLQRALLAAGTAFYDSPEFPALDKVPDALQTIVKALGQLGFTTVARSPGYHLNPSLPRLRAAVRETAPTAPVVV